MNKIERKIINIKKQFLFFLLLAEKKKKKMRFKLQFIFFNFIENILDMYVDDKFIQLFS